MSETENTHPNGSLLSMVVKDLVDERDHFRARLKEYENDYMALRDVIALRDRANSDLVAQNSLLRHRLKVSNARLTLVREAVVDAVESPDLDPRVGDVLDAQDVAIYDQKVKAMLEAYSIVKDHDPAKEYWYGDTAPLPDVNQAVKSSLDAANRILHDVFLWLGTLGPTTERSATNNDLNQLADIIHESEYIESLMP